MTKIKVREKSIDVDLIVISKFSKVPTEEKVVVLVDPRYTKDSSIFSGVMIAGKSAKNTVLGEYRNDWCWDSFIPFRGEITLEQ